MAEAAGAPHFREVSIICFGFRQCLQFGHDSNDPHAIKRHSDLECAAKKKAMRPVYGPDRGGNTIGGAGSANQAALPEERESRAQVDRNLAHICGATVHGSVRRGKLGCVLRQQATHRFVDLDLTREAAPDATRRLTCRRRLEKHELTPRIFKTIAPPHKAECGLIMREGTIVNATLIAAAPSTKKKRIVAFPRCISPRKARTGMSGCRRTPVLIRHRSGGGDERMVFGDVGYQGRQSP